MSKGGGRDRHRRPRFASCRRRSVPMGVAQPTTQLFAFHPWRQDQQVDDAEDDITAARCRQINERFYRADPAGYFRTRLLTLLTLAGNPEGVLELLRQG